VIKEEARVWRSGFGGGAAFSWARRELGSVIVVDFPFGFIFEC